MARTLTKALLFLFLIGGCAALNKEEGQAPKPSEPIAVPLSSPPAEPPRDQSFPVASNTNPTPSKEEIRMLQARLKAAGFYLGPVDGIVGPKTRSGLFRLQASCANLKDLLEASTTATPPAQLDSAGNNSPKSDEIRMIQVRLKDAGFDPGPLDAVSGAKTRSALLRFRAGCTMLQNLPLILDKELQTTDRQTSPIWEEKRYRTVAKSVGLDSDMMSGKQILSNDKIRQDQLRLKDAGFDPGPIDGILGPKTKAAMQRYQKSFERKNS